MTVMGVLAMSSAACSPEEPTVADLFAEVEGRELSQAELVDAERTANLLCQLEDDVLVTVWSQLDETQLAFQDVVFSRQCPARLDLYARETGRFSSGES